MSQTSISDVSYAATRKSAPSANIFAVDREGDHLDSQELRKKGLEKMLLGISPQLSPDLLSTLVSMGHGDEIAIVDANFPAASTARRLCRADGTSATALLAAILSVMPIDDFEACAAWRMEVVDNPSEIPPVCAEFVACLREAGYEGLLAPLERHAFYGRSRDAFAIVATGETRLYGNILLRKGIVRQEPLDKRS